MRVHATICGMHIESDTIIQHFAQVEPCKQKSHQGFPITENRKKCQIVYGG